MPATHHDTPTLRIGPGADPLEPDAELMDRARAEAQRRQDDEALGKAIARRILVAFVACVLIAVACFVLIPVWTGVVIPAWVPMLSFLAITAGAILTVPGSTEPKDASACEDEGTPIGCCPGPRPLRSFREDR